MPHFYFSALSVFSIICKSLFFSTYRFDILLLISPLPASSRFRQLQENHANEYGLHLNITVFKVNYKAMDVSFGYNFSMPTSVVGITDKTL
jgi:hypothetical protein